MKVLRQSEVDTRWVSMLSLKGVRLYYLEIEMLMSISENYSDDLAGDMTTSLSMLPDTRFGGRFSENGQDVSDYIRLEVTDGGEYHLSINYDYRNYLPAWDDLSVTVYDSAGAVVATTTARGWQTYDLSFTAEYDGDYFVELATDRPVYGSSSVRYTGLFLEVTQGIGTDQSDTVIGTEANDIIAGQAGDDTLAGAGGSNTIMGGDGDDLIRDGGDYSLLLGGAGNDRIFTAVTGDFGWFHGVPFARAFGQDGDDEIAIGASHGFIGGGAGNDLIWFVPEMPFPFRGEISGGSGNDTLYLRGNYISFDAWGGDGDDAIYLGGGEVRSEVLRYGGGDGNIDAGAGNDTIAVETSFFVGSVQGGGGDDLITLAVQPNERSLSGHSEATLYAGHGHDLVITTAVNAYGDITIHTNSGNDTVIGGDIVHWIDGESGHDDLSGGSRADTIIGGVGSDTIRGGGGDDSIVGGTFSDYTIDSADTLLGGAGADTVHGHSGADRVEGGTGNDLLGGGFGDDLVFGQQGNDTLYGGLGDDTLWGGAGNDELAGGGDNDRLFGGFGDDTLYGGAGNDTLNGTEGDDRLTGLTGRDAFIFSQGSDTATDFTIGEDRVVLRAAVGIADFADLASSHLTDTGAGVLVTDESGNSLLLEGVALADLSASDFVF